MTVPIFVEADPSGYTTSMLSELATTTANFTGLNFANRAIDWLPALIGAKEEPGQEL
jgi:hypothetical protein